MKGFESRAARKNYESRLNKAKKTGRFRIQKNGTLMMVLPLFLMLFLAAALEFNDQLKNDHRYMPGVAKGLIVAAAPADKSDQEIFDLINKQAKEQKVNIYRLAKTDPKTVYTFVGNPDRLLADPVGKNTFTRFDPFYVRKFVPYQQAVDARVIPPGSYLTDADDLEAKKLKEAFRRQNIGTHVYELGFEAPSMLDKSRIEISLPMLILALLTLIGGGAYAAARRWKTITLRRVVGWPALKAVAWDYVIVIRAMLLTAILSLGALCGLLWLYNGAFNLEIILMPVLAAGAVGILTLLAVQTLMLLVMATYRLGKLLTGHLPQRLLTGLLVTLQVMAFGTVLYNANVVLAKAKDHDTLANFSKQYDDLYTISRGLSWQFDNDARTNSLDPLKSFIRTSEAEGLMLFSSRESARISEEKVTRYDPPSGMPTIMSEVIDKASTPYHLVNDIYLQRFPVLLTNGNALRGNDLSEEGVRIGITDDLPQADRNTLIEAIPQQLSIPAGSLEIVKLQPRQESTLTREIKIDAFKFPPKQSDLPIVISKRLQQDVLDAPFFYLHRSAMFSNYARLKQLMKDSGFAPFVHSIEAADAGVYLQAPPDERYPNLVMASTAFLLSSLLLTWLYLQRSRRRVYLQILFGRGFWHRHWRYFVELAAGGVLLIVGGAAFSTLFGADAVFNKALPRAPLGISVLVVTLIISLFYTWTQDRRLDFDTIKDG